MLALTLVVLTASPQLSVAAPELVTVGLEPGLGVLYSEHLAQQMSLRGLRIVTARDMGLVLGLERQKELLGCKDAMQGSCMAELASALGADGVLTGEIGRVGQSIQVNLKIISPQNGAPLASHTARVSDNEAVLGALDQAAKSMVEQLARALQRPLPELTAEARRSLGEGGSKRSPIAFVPGALGLVAVGVATGLLIDARGQYSELLRIDGPMLMPADAARIRAQGERNQTIGWVLVGVGAAGVVGSVAWYLLGGSGPAASAWVTPDAAGVSIAGAWP